MTVLPPPLPPFHQIRSGPAGPALVCFGSGRLGDDPRLRWGDASAADRGLYTPAAGRLGGDRPAPRPAGGDSAGEPAMPARAESGGAGPAHPGPLVMRRITSSLSLSCRQDDPEVRALARPPCFRPLACPPLVFSFAPPSWFRCRVFVLSHVRLRVFRALSGPVPLFSRARPSCFRLLARLPAVFSFACPLASCVLVLSPTAFVSARLPYFSFARLPVRPLLVRLLPSFRPLARSPAVFRPPVRHVFRSAPVVLWSSVRHAFAVFCSPFWGVGCAPAASFAIGGGRSTAKGCYCAAPRKYRLTRVKGAASLTCRDTNAESWSMPSIRNGPHAHRMDRWGPSGCTMETDGSWRCKSLRGRSCCPGWLRRRSSWHRSAEERGNAKVALRIKARSEVTDNELCEKSCHPHEITSCFIHGLCRNHLCLKSRHDRD